MKINILHDNQYSEHTSNFIALTSNNTHNKRMGNGRLDVQRLFIQGLQNYTELILIKRVTQLYVSVDLGQGLWKPSWTKKGSLNNKELKINGQVKT